MTCPSGQGRRCRTAGWAITSSKVPSARIDPKSMTTVRSTTSLTMDRSCSTSKIAVPRSRCTVRSTAARSAVSWISSPDEGSSAKRIFGSEARARASSTKRQCPKPRAFTDVSANEAIPTSSKVASTFSDSSLVTPLMFKRSFQSRPPPRRERSATSEMVPHAHVGEHFHLLIRSADAEPSSLEGGKSAQRGTLEQNFAAVISKLPAYTVEQGRLAGPVGTRPGQRSPRRARRTRCRGRHGFRRTTWTRCAARATGRQPWVSGPDVP